MQFHHLYALMRYAQSYSHQQIKNVGISDTEHLICAFIFGHPDSSQDQIAHALQIDKATIAKALASLEKKGYIQRISNPENRRKNIINITPSGRETISDLVGIYDSWLSELSEALTPNEWNQFEEYCQRLLEAARARNMEEQ